MRSFGKIGLCGPAFSVLGVLALAGCGGGGTPSGNFSLGGGTSGGSAGGGTVSLSGFVLTATSHSAANSLAWTAPTVTGATNASDTYDIYRAAGATRPLATLASGLSVSAYTDAAVTAGTTYRYQVTAHAAGLTGTSNTDSATAGGPMAVGVGDPATDAPPAGTLFTAALVQYASQPTGGRLTVSVTLSHAASASDLQTVEVGGNVYTPNSGVSVSGDQVFIDSLAAGIPVPALQPGQYASVVVTVANATNPVVPNAGRLELTGRAPAAGRTETDGPAGFQITVSEG